MCRGGRIGCGRVGNDALAECTTNVEWEIGTMHEADFTSKLPTAGTGAGANVRGGAAGRVNIRLHFAAGMGMKGDLT